MNQRNSKNQEANLGGISGAEAGVRKLFDALSDEYDDIRDLWYSWLFSRLHYLIARYVLGLSDETLRRCLDVGCGTGFQTLLLALCGCDTVGVDIATKLVAAASRKEPSEYAASSGLFSSPYGFVASYDRRVQGLASAARAGRDIGRVAFQVSSATELPFDSAEFDLVNCCGSTLSFIEDYQTGISEMARVLRPGGHAIVEVENKYNMDLMWSVFDSLIGGAIGYEQNMRRSLAGLLSPRLRHITTTFPFSTHEGEVDMEIWLFSAAQLVREFRQAGLKVERVSGIHSLTNLIPSVVLDTSTPGMILRGAFRFLSGAEQVFGSLPIVQRLGCSAVYFCRRTD